MTTSQPREKLLNVGPDTLTDAELLAILINTGYAGKNVHEFAKDLLKKYSLKRLPLLNAADLMGIKGFGPAQAAKLMAAFALSDRVSTDRVSAVISNLQDVVKLTNHLKYKKREYLVGLYLNARNHLIKKIVLSIGTVDASLVHAREVFAPAISLRATNIILIHNHPSGDPNPSPEDIRVTTQLIKAGQLLGIELLDHVIVARNGVFSFRRKKRTTNKA